MDRMLTKAVPRQGDCYDVLFKPKNSVDDAIIVEFKVHDAEDEKTLKDTVDAVLLQIYIAGARKGYNKENTEENRNEKRTGIS